MASGAAAVRGDGERLAGVASGGAAVRGDGERLAGAWASGAMACVGCRRR